jgi:hypothetical protein
MYLGDWKLISNAYLCCGRQTTDPAGPEAQDHLSPEFASEAAPPAPSSRLICASGHLSLTGTGRSSAVCWSLRCLNSEGLWDISREC